MDFPALHDTNFLTTPDIDEGAILLHLSGLPVLDRNRDEVVFLEYPYSLGRPGLDDDASYESYYQPEENDAGRYQKQRLADIWPLQPASEMRLQHEFFPSSVNTSGPGGIRIVDFVGCDVAQAAAFISAGKHLGTIPRSNQPTPPFPPGPSAPPPHERQDHERLILQRDRQEQARRLFKSPHLNVNNGFITGLSLQVSRADRNMTMFVSIPHLGLGYRNQDPAGSKTLNQYRFIHATPPVKPSPAGNGKTILVHQTWFLMLDKDDFGVFRSSEDLAGRAPLFQNQDRRGGFQALVHMIANTITASEQAAFRGLRRDVAMLEMEIRGSVPNAATTAGLLETPTPTTESPLNTTRNSTRASVITARNDPENDPTSTASVTGSQAGPPVGAITRHELIALTSTFDEYILDVSTILEIILLQIQQLRDLLYIFQNQYTSHSWNKNRIHWNSFPLPQFKNTKEQMGDVLPAIEGLIAEREMFRIEATSFLRDLELTRLLFTTGVQTELAENLQHSLSRQGQKITLFTFLTTAFVPLGFFTSYYSMSPPNFEETIHTQMEFWSICWPWSSVLMAVMGLFLFRPDDYLIPWFVRLTNQFPWVRRRRAKKKGLRDTIRLAKRGLAASAAQIANRPTMTSPLFAAVESPRNLSGESIGPI